MSGNRPSLGSRRNASVDYGNNMNRDSDAKPSTRRPFLFKNEHIMQNIEHTMKERDFFTALVTANHCIKKLNNARLIEMKHIAKVG